VIDKVVFQGLANIIMDLDEKKNTKAEMKFLKLFKLQKNIIKKQKQEEREK